MRARAYTASLLSCTLGGFVAAMGLLLWLNPFQLFAWPVRAINQRPMQTHGEVFKIGIIEHLQPELIIFGNSRAETGFGVDEAVTGIANGANAAISGGTFAEVSRLATHALQHAHPRIFIISIDPDSFSKTSIRPSFGQLRIGEPLGTLQQYWRKILFHAHWEFFWNEAEARLISRGERPEPFLQGRRGLRNEESMQHQVNEDHGSRNASFRWEQSFAKKPTNLAAATAHNFTLYRQLLAASCARGVRVITLIPPIHDRMVTVWLKTYGRDFLSQWISQLHEATVAARTGCQAQVPELWSAIVKASVRDEPLPAAGNSAAEMTHYWETSHFRRHLGDDVLAQILVGATPSWITVRKIDADIDAAPWPLSDHAQVIPRSDVSAPLSGNSALAAASSPLRHGGEKRL